MSSTEAMRKLAGSHLLKQNVFQTERGEYRITLWGKKNGEIYLLKQKEGAVVELLNLSDISKKSFSN